MKKVIFFFILIFFVVLNLFSLEKEIKYQLKSRLNFSEQQIANIEAIVLNLDNKKLPIEPLKKLLNEAISKKVQYEQLILVLEKTINSLELAKRYIENTKTEKFFPKDLSYSISLLSEFIRLGLTEEEFKTLISVLSVQNNSYEESLMKINYYLVFKKYFNFSDNNFLKEVKVSNPAEIIFFRYTNRSLKDFSLIIQAVVKYFSTSSDRRPIYYLLYSNNILSTKKLIEKIDGLIKEDFKKEIKE